eukprot:COSAG01_NODE_3835_length_5649_cov_36.487474_5_plen_71_part_00
MAADVLGRESVHLRRSRVRVEIMGSQTYENGGESQSLLIMNDPMISTRTRIYISSSNRSQHPCETCSQCH